MQKGWISLHRSIQDHWLYQEKRKFSRYEAWIDLIMMANHEDKKTLIGNELVEVKRGERITSIRKLCEKWNWSNTKVTQFLNLLESDGMVVVKSDSKKTLVSIVNYDLYQGGNDKETTQKIHVNDGEATQKRTNNNVNNSNNENNENKNNYDPHFESFWKIYPKRVAKKDAAKAFLSLIKSGESLEDILTATRNYARERNGQDSKFTQHPTTFLRNDRWKDWLSVKKDQHQSRQLDDREKSIAKEIAFNKWTSAGNSEDDFHWDREACRQIMPEEFEQQKREFDQMLSKGSNN